METPKKPYAVGYRSPPAATQFKPGQSGNPGGRPKGRQNFVTTVARLLRERVVIILKNGRRRSVTKLEAALTAMMNRAITGDARATQQMLQLAGLVDAALATGHAADFSETDKAVLANVLQRLGIEDATADPRTTTDKED